MIRNGMIGDGLYIVSVPSGYDPYVQVGWLRHLGGDEWELVGGRVIRSFGSSHDLALIATNGPESDTKLLSASPSQPVHRLHMHRLEPCSVEAWAKVCPRPPKDLPLPAWWAER